MTIADHKRKSQADTLYTRYGKPLESTHRGEYVAVWPNGKTVLGTSLLEVVETAVAKFGPGSFVFKIGEKAVGKWL